MIEAASFPATSVPTAGEILARRWNLSQIRIGS